MIVAAPTASADQQASIDDAIAMWRARGVTGLEIGDLPTVTIAFRDAADAVHGFYDDTSATVYVNLRLEDRAQRAITIAHELGHAFGLLHIAATLRPSVMNSGNVTISPTAQDEAELATLWGACQ
jgi:Zn-dependent peptidase ImmA (M78 family)